MRKLGLISTLWAGLLFFPVTSFALGLGEIEASSFLNQPLKAEIQVISARPGEIDDLLISLASRDAFDKAGLERPAGLSKLRFKVEKSEDGLTAKILVSTKKPVVEPFLSFLVEADWAKGRLLREFTVLLDPLSFAQQVIKVAPEQAESRPSEPTPAQVEITEVASEVEPQAVDQGLPIASQPMTSQPIAMPVESSSSEESLPYVTDSEYLDSPASDEQVVVAKGDTLWGIAAKFKDQNHSMAQVMLAMQMMNPDAFSRDNINNLKVGAVLRVPDMDVMDKLSKQEAYAQVLDQNGLWDEYVARKSGSTSNAVVDSSNAIESTQEEAESQLSLLTADEGDSDSASLQNDANSEDAGQIRKQLALAEEELEAARLENDDLNARISMLEEQQSKFEELQKLVQIEDSSLAQLQQKTAEEDAIAEEAVAVVEEAMTETAEEVTDSMAEEIPTEEKPSEVMIEAAGEMLAENVEQESEQTMEASTDGMTDEMMDEALSTEAETVLPTMEEEGSIIEDNQTSQLEETPSVLPAPVIITQPEPSAEEGLLDMLPSMDKLLNDPVMLGGIGAILALLLGFVFIKRKKSSESDEGIILDEPDDLLDEDATPIHIPSTTNISVDDADESEVSASEIDAQVGMAETQVSEVEDNKEKIEATEEISLAEISDTEEPSAEQDDVLNEADVYLAYGLYDNAESLLTESLQNSPERADYRAKLLDTHFATKNKDAFVKEAEILKSLGGAADRFWDRIQIMGFELASENELFSEAEGSNVSVEDLEYAKPESADFDIGTDKDVTDFSNTDFDLGDDSFDVSSTQVMDIPDEFSTTQDLDSLDIDFPDLDEISELEPEDTPDVEFESADDLSVENELDIDLDSEDDLSFDLPDDMDLSSDAEIIELDPTVEAPTPLNEVPPIGDEDNLDVELAETNQADQDVDDSELTNQTLVMTPDGIDTESGKVETDEMDAEISLDEGLDFDMSDMDDASLQSGSFTPSDEVAFSTEGLKEDDITEFKPANATGEFDAFITEATNEDAIAEADVSSELDELDSLAPAEVTEGAIVEVDASAGLDSTGTYAPGDFNEDEIAELIDVDEIGNIEDLMLPDDVDEVATKLDLAKAFIDMGDAEGARSSLEEVMSEGSDEQQAEATELLDQIK